MSAVNRQVVKLGGSLLSWPRVNQELMNWLALNSLEQNLVIVGGGERVDRLRLEQHALRLTDEECHWLAIDQMSQNANRFAESLGLPVWTASLEERCPPASLTSTWLVDLQPLLRSLDSLPHSWQITSDSIAAWYAHEVQASALVLLKSRSPEPHETRHPSSLAAAKQPDEGGESLVDPRFWHYAGEALDVKLVNLRRGSEGSGKESLGG